MRDDTNPRSRLAIDLDDTGELGGAARLRGFLLAFALSVLCGCTTFAPPHEAAREPESPCRAYFSLFDDAVTSAGVRDAESAPVPGFPYLRVDRFLASYRHELADADLPAWTDALLRMDREARAVEFANLPHAARERLLAGLQGFGLPAAEPASLTGICGARLRDQDLASRQRRSQLRDAATVPDDYATWQRVVGLYALTRIPFAYGIRRYQADVRATFDTPLDELPLVGRVVRYAPEHADASDSDPRETIARVQRAGAAFRAPDAGDVERLLADYAPVFEVDQGLPEDRIGSVHLSASGRPEVATDVATVYGRIAFTRFSGRVWVQAVYTAWFPARPETGVFDLLGGDFDALVWRVTLAEDGAPLVFDSMHACGCYHLFVTTPRMVPRPRPDTLDEWALVAQTLPALSAPRAAASRQTPRGGQGNLGTARRFLEDARTPVRLRIASRTHYLVRVGVGTSAAERTYALRPEQSLRSLEGADGIRRSLYGADAIVAGSERGERFFFWPMGVRAPGAMRQWGRHATAFVGRRHFDDADLLDRYFTLRLPEITPDGGPPAIQP